MSVPQILKALVIGVALFLLLVLVALTLQLASWLLPAACIVGVGWILLADTEDKPKQ